MNRHSQYVRLLCGIANVVSGASSEQTYWLFLSEAPRTQSGMIGGPDILQLRMGFNQPVSMTELEYQAFGSHMNFYYPGVQVCYALKVGKYYSGIYLRLDTDLEAYTSNNTIIRNYNYKDLYEDILNSGLDFKLQRLSSRSMSVMFKR